MIAVKLSKKDAVNRSHLESLTLWSFSFKRKSLIIVVFRRQAFTRFRLVDNEVSSVFLWKQLCLSLVIDETTWMFQDTATTPKPSVNQTWSQAGLVLFWVQKSLSWREESMEYSFFTSLSDFLTAGGEQVCMLPLMIFGEWQSATEKHVNLKWCTGVAQQWYRCWTRLFSCHTDWHSS